MTLEGALVVALSIASTSAVGFGLGGARRQAMPIPRGAARLALVANVFVMPLVAWLAVRGLALGATGTGVILAAALPGGSTGPLLASLAGGDLRVATRWFVILTSVGTAAALLATLALAPGGLNRVVAAAALVFAVSVVPLVVARAASARGWLGARSAKIASLGSVALLVATVIALLVQHAAHVEVPSLAASAIVVVAGLGAMLLPRLPTAARAAIVEVGTVRNLTLALVVMEVVGAPPAARVAALGYGLVMYLAAAGFAGWTRYAARR